MLACCNLLIIHRWVIPKPHTKFNQNLCVSSYAGHKLNIHRKTHNIGGGNKQHSYAVARGTSAVPGVFAPKPNYSMHYKVKPLRIKFHPNPHNVGRDVTHKTKSDHRGGKLSEWVDGPSVQCRGPKSYTHMLLTLLITKHTAYAITLHESMP